jgi:putative FmdB family regulatory protein
MPTYEYACRACGHHFEARQSFSEAPLTTCPVCQGEVRRVFHPVGIVFKGSGWYITDSRNGSQPSESGAKSEEKGEVKADAKGESKAESKAEAKSESKSESKSEGKSAKAEPAAAKH